MNRAVTPLKPIRIRKVPAFIPLRLAISWWEFLRWLRETPRALVAFIRDENVMIADEDIPITR